ncbi:MAG TPA: RNA polymerase sigma factor [Gemmatimonadales bacterium]|nr:RNA polymerase sigma factor [Gemmatimonadales bacterium]
MLAGDVELYGVLVHRYRDRYARYAARMLGSLDAAEDAVQDAFVRAYERLGQCREPDKFAGWFFLILRNRCFAMRRDGRVTRSLSDDDEGVAARGEADERVQAGERRRALEQALMRLTAEQRDVFVLKHVEAMSYDEIAALTGVPVASLKMRMHRAYDRLRAELKEFAT